MSPRGYQPGALSWLTTDLEVGSETFPRIVHRPAEPAKVSLDAAEEREPAGAWLGWPGEGAWCE